jgi:uncharacterized repeat protein (TIGR03803 family)
MTKRTQLLETHLHAVSIALALAIALVPATVGTRVQAQGFTVLYSFTGYADGGYPYAGLILDAASWPYGTVFMLDKTGKETVLYSFCSRKNCKDGANPYAGLVRDAAGNLYGTTWYGGTGGCKDDYGSGCGTVFKVDKTGKETVLYSFTKTRGTYPYAGLVVDAAGNLYGTTVKGGASGHGTVFMLDKTGKETVLHSFSGVPDGAYPYAGLVRDAAGNLYGTTVNGGAHDYGTVFMLDKTGKETVLHSFTGTGGRGGNPYAGLIRDAAGNLYGTTSGGGHNGRGTVFKLDKAGKETVLHSFLYGDGVSPRAGLVRDANGNLYGTTESGGPHCCGTVFELTP